MKKIFVLILTIAIVSSLIRLPASAYNYDVHAYPAVDELVIDDDTSEQLIFYFSGAGIGKVGFSASAGINISITSSSWKAYPKRCEVYLEISANTAGVVTMYLFDEDDGSVITTTSCNVVPSKNTIDEVIQKLADEHIGNTYKSYGGSSTTPWCGYFVRSFYVDVLKKMGYSTSEAKQMIPWNSLSSTCTTAYTFTNNPDFGDYHSYASWNYSFYSSAYGKTITAKGKNTDTNTSYIPKPGCIMITETNNNLKDGPDHLALIIDVADDGSWIKTIEGNTGAGSTATRTVKTYTYIKSSYTVNGQKISSWIRKGCSGLTTRVIGICQPHFIDN